MSPSTDIQPYKPDALCNKQTLRHSLHPNNLQAKLSLTSLTWCRADCGSWLRATLSPVLCTIATLTTALGETIHPSLPVPAEGDCAGNHPQVRSWPQAPFKTSQFLFKQFHFTNEGDMLKTLQITTVPISQVLASVTSVLINNP